MVKISFAIVLTFLAIVQAQTITPPDQTSSRLNQEEQAIVDEGAVLHDQGKYDEAAAKYKLVLDKNPNNVLVVYKMASSYFAAAKYDDCLNFATQGSRFKSDYLPQFYLMIGNSLDKLGKTEDAISAFKQELEILPDNQLLHFNLAAMLSNTGAFDEARSHLKTAVQLDPKHASSHYALGQIYYKQEYRIPSTLALFRFLTLEPKSQRSQKALSMLNENFNQEAAETTPKDEADFSKYELILSSAQKSKNAPNRLELLDKLFSIMGNEKEQGKFVIDYYFPYFIALKKNGLVEAFMNYIYQSSDQEATQWIKNRPDDVKRFLEWSTHFQH
ncbi:tetratricopeptide repeat protein [bacterium]|nr:tetratricopeptide repeat protein [bacterium]